MTDDATITSATPQPSAATVERLVVAFCPDPQVEQRTLLLGPEAETLGRAGGACRLTFADGEMSRAHARIELHDDRRVVADLGSHNGTFVGGAPCERHALHHGDVLRLGSTLLVYTRHVLGTDDPLEPERPPLFGRSLAMDRLRGQIGLAAGDDRPTLVVGETGTGKELVSQLLHELAGRAGPLVAINCGALPAQLVEAQLFGHRRGAFTGATEDGEGLLRRAADGTVLLDEVGEMPLELQPKLLRALGSGEAMAVGSVDAYGVTARVVAATNRDLEQAVASGAFRRDLYMRLASWVLRVPPLRERREDIIALARHFLGSTGLTADAAEALLIHDWTGNVRELEQCVGVAAVRAAGVIEVPHLPAALRETSGQRRVARGTTDPPTGADPTDGAPLVVRVPPDREPDRDGLMAALAEHDGKVAPTARYFKVSRRMVYRWIESHRIDLDELRDEAARLVDALKRCAGNATRAAAELGVDRKTVYRMAERHGIDLTRFRPPSD